MRNSVLCRYPFVHIAIEEPSVAYIRHVLGQKTVGSFLWGPLSGHIRRLVVVQVVDVRECKEHLFLRGFHDESLLCEAVFGAHAEFQVAEECSVVLLF